MKINGNKLCPDCGYRHTLFRPWSQPAIGWDCPGCGRRLTRSFGRGLVTIFASSFLIAVLSLFMDFSARDRIIVLPIFMGFLMFMMHLSLDVRAAD